MEDFDTRVEALQSELLKRRVHTVPSGRWSAYQHGVATFRILEAWNRPQVTQLAGLAWAAGGDKRRGLRRVIGDEADQLAGLVGTASAETAGVAPGDGQSAAGGEANAIGLAALAERSCAEDGSPALWLSRASQLAAEIARATAQPVPLFSDGTKLVAERDEIALIGAYRHVVESTARPDSAALAALVKASDAVPWVAEPLIMLGLMRLADDDAAAAIEYGTRASEILLSWNCAWDKRLSEFSWFSLAGFLQGQKALAEDERTFSARRVAALLGEHGGSPLTIFAHLDAVGVLNAERQTGDNGITVYEGRTDDDDHNLDDLEFDELPTRFQLYLSRLGESNAALHMQTYPSLTARPWWDPDEVGVTQRIAEAADAVFAELQADDRVRGLGDGEMAAVQVQDRFPALAGLVEKQANAVAADGGISVIAVGPSSKFVGERAISNLHLRCISAVDDGDVTVIVNGVPDVLRRGDSLLFDPVFAHEFKAAGDAPARVLCIDVWHPELSPNEVQLLAGFARYVRDLVSEQCLADSNAETVQAVGAGV